MAAINRDHKESCMQCFIACMSAWLRGEDKVKETGDGPSWLSLVSALETTGDYHIATNIKHKYLTPWVPFLLLLVSLLVATFPFKLFSHHFKSQDVHVVYIIHTKWKQCLTLERVVISIVNPIIVFIIRLLLLQDSSLYHIHTVHVLAGDSVIRHW